MFRGVSSIHLDDKGRLAVPTRYRAELDECCDNQLVVTVGLDKCLLLYPLPEFEDIERKLVKLPALNKQAKRLQRLLIGHAAECQLDSQGRCLIPEPLRRFALLEKRVALVGQGNKFELWDEDTWNRSRDEWIEAERLGDDEDLPPELGTLSL
ncbi:division/cell wall cluster transcriptional repressor MraZ [Methylomagnum ishizawai]|uniref:division/cell wall cluster transcriptional repressor MraZ n=1 Tax=Methylomagnum ishizawai TaxID=1760988 RepID=UPI001C323629|nr:division/cell wall cluster transcriptional repressor MraZ [Methylomagnum ishizawai]BBL73547.1 transcriptional regulator MraZ [Methylomagnum ishizawai]